MGSAVLPPKTAVLVSAIARPARFQVLVGSGGVEVRDRVRFRDHRWLTEADVEAAAVLARRRGADGLVTTEKDAVRWPATVPSDNVWVLPIRLEIIAGEARLDQALRRVLP